MKKQLLCAALLLGAVSVNAQIEKFNVDGTVAGLTTDLQSIAEGTVLGSSTSVTAKAAYEDSYKTVSCAFQGYNTVTVNGESLTFGDGAQGNTNPSGQSLGDGTSTAPTGGAVLQLDVTKNGYIAIVSKLSSNKEYYVWEGDATYASPVAYSLYMDWSSAANDAYPTITYTMPADKDGYIDFAAADIEKYVNLTTGKVLWPEKIVLGADAADVKKNGVGVIVFPVYAEAGSYLVHAAGSKISTAGVIFSPDPITSLSISGEDGDGNPLNINFIGGASAIENVTAAKENANAPIFNLAGQQVNKAYKGVVIQNGKKFIQK